MAKSPYKKALNSLVGDSESKHLKRGAKDLLRHVHVPELFEFIASMRGAQRKQLRSLLKRSRRQIEVYKGKQRKEAHLEHHERLLESLLANFGNQCLIQLQSREDKKKG